MAHYKLCIYGEPAVGKSVFALGFPKPFFICTDENYDFLKEFGAKEENHKQVTTWAEFKNFIKTFDFSSYDTIVVDLLEDLYQWAESEYCKKNQIEDLSDIGYGKAYKIVRNDYATTISSLINKNANFIGLTHEEDTSKKTNRGTEYIEYTPSSLIPDKCWTLINGKLRFFFRAHIEEVNKGDKIIRKRLLSVSPKPHEFQINRGMNVDMLPDDIELSAKAFFETFGTPNEASEGVKKANVKPVAKPAEVKPVEAKTAVEEKKSVSEEAFNATIEKVIEATKAKREEEAKAKAEQPKAEEPKAEEPKVEPKPEPKSSDDKKKDGYAEIERIKAILASKKKGIK